MIGTGFMGRAHSNAWMSVNKFFDLPRSVVMATCVDLEPEVARAFADKWGWDRGTADLGEALADESVDLVDVVTPNYLHAEHSIAALEAGKHVACEKPLAGTLADARAMRDAARRAKRRGLSTFVWYNYRRCPAVAFARALVAGGKLGRIYHVRACYLQDWGGPDTPMSWRYDARLAGSGAHGDLNAHIVDITRFVTGEEITEVVGAIAETFIKQRKKLSGGVGESLGAGAGADEMGDVTVDDAVLFLARFSGGAVASFEAARQATGNQNRNTFEINGTQGSVKFNFERMNELEYYDATRPGAVRGWTTIMCTHGADYPDWHAYVANWWPDAHIIGYEHGFTNQAYDILRVLAGEEPTVPIPDFNDAYQTQRVLEASLLSASEGRPVKLDEVK
jgi:predicted dehydrogenase